ncbi:MAG: hypothetical protein J6Y91_04605 [Alphaproteobacteria bacterium]|nr:hypothetical protein [Alphaproteobacteria bacterium]
MTNISDTPKISTKLNDLFSFHGKIGVRTFLTAALFLELCAWAMDMYLLKYENDFATYALALNNPGFIGLYLFGYALIIMARLRDMNLPRSWAYFWIWALWLCRFGIRSAVNLPLGTVCVAVILILLPLCAKDKDLLCLKK